MSIDAPLCLHGEQVRPEWIDYNGHMNLAYFVLVLDHATDAFFDFVGLDEARRLRTGQSMFALEMRVRYARELKVGEQMRTTTQLLDYDHKRVHFFHHLYHAGEGYLAATNELIHIHVDQNGPRAVAMPESVQARLHAVMQAHRALPVPPEAGARIGIRRG